MMSNKWAVLTMDLFVFRLGSWQFLAELPYEMTSSRSIWNLLRLMHQGCYKVDTSSLQIDLSSEECMQLITGTRAFIIGISFKVR